MSIKDIKGSMESYGISDLNKVIPCSYLLGYIIEMNMLRKNIPLKNVIDLIVMYVEGEEVDEEMDLRAWVKSESVDEFMRELYVSQGEIKNQEQKKHLLDEIDQMKIQLAELNFDNSTGLDEIALMEKGVEEDRKEIGTEQNIQSDDMIQEMALELD